MTTRDEDDVRPREYSLISADSHVVEPPDLFLAGLPAHMRSRAPRMEEHDGVSTWAVEGQPPVELPVFARNMGEGSRFDDLDLAVHDPVERLAAQETDSLDAEVLYSSPRLWDAIKQLDDPELRLACTRAHNDWIARFSGHDRDRLIGLGRISSADAGEATTELRRCVDELDLRGVVLDTWPGGTPTLDGPGDQFWGAVEETGIPVSLHIAVGDAASTSPPSGIFAGVRPPMADASLALLGSGVFERYPGVRLVLAHGDAGWAFHWLEFMDANYMRRRHLPGHRMPFADPDALPSEYLRRHCWFTFHQDRTVLKNRALMGTSHLLWASEYPLDGTDWPEDRGQAVRTTDGLDTEDRHAVLAENTARLYRLPGHEAGFPAAAVDAFEPLVHL
ncbi:MAG TPA: amidohydrolase family protein [Acidimicrobiales bacterium]